MKNHLWRVTTDIYPDASGEKLIGYFRGTVIEIEKALRDKNVGCYGLNFEQVVIFDLEDVNLNSQEYGYIGNVSVKTNDSEITKEKLKEHGLQAYVYQITKTQG